MDVQQKNKGVELKQYSEEEAGGGGLRVACPGVLLVLQSTKIIFCSILASYRGGTVRRQGVGVGNRAVGG